MKTRLRNSAANCLWMTAAVSFLCFVAQLARAQDSTAAAKPGVSLATCYLADPVDQAHQILIQGELGGDGKVTLDGNTCTTTQFGDKGICTKIFFRPIDVKIVQLRLADPSGQGRRIYRLNGKLKPEGATFYLIVPRRRSGVHRLVVDSGGDKRRVITLEGRTLSPPSGKPELCKDVKYRAEQKAGRVTIYATGSNSTSGWKNRFEQLPIRIFPPQFRAVCVKPTGIVAQVITPFAIETSFQAKQAVPHVIVHDADGQHKLTVKQSSNKE